ncbi:MAG: GNAT family N-acetyltransferase [Bacteroidetes bacterium]|nr:GNAT family N-acetyltransferase [Bacteroidota bacterium]
MIFETTRLYVRQLKESDEAAFFELMSNPNVMNPIPQKTFGKEESVSKLAELILLEKSSDTKMWCLCKKGNNDLIGISGVLKNDDGEDEIAYRIIERYWGHGYGTEIAKGLIDYCFVNLKSNLVTADVFVDNVKSVKILDKYFSIKKEFFNAEDNCMDRRYVLRKEDWV